MRSLSLPPRPLTIAALGLVLAVGLTGCGAGAEPHAKSSADPSTATVVGVVDGHTVDVVQGDEALTVRLAGLESPAPDECLGAESAAALSDLLPPGTEVRLETGDAAGADGVAAAVYAGDVLVNAELARLGLSFAVDETAGAIAKQVGKAQEEAVSGAVGLFGADAECTVPAQVAALEKAGSEAADAAGALAAGVGVDEVDRRGAAVTAAVAAGTALASLLDGDTAARYPAPVASDLRDRTVAVNERLVGASSTVQQVRASEEQRVAAEAAAAQAAADEAARQAQAAADAEAARVAAAAAAAAAAEVEAPAAPSGGSAYYANCTAVRAAGADPIHVGEPGYSRKLDRDGDGIACE